MISLLECSINGVDIELTLTPGSRLAALHGVGTIVEHTTCNYGLDPGLQSMAEAHGLIVSAVDDTGEVRAIERPGHPFFVATLYQPQLNSTAEAPHPIFTAFVEAAVAGDR